MDSRPRRSRRPTSTPSASGRPPPPAGWRSAGATTCALWLHPPLHECRRCGGKTRFEPVSGRGTIYTYTVVRHPAVPGYLEHLPYVIAIVELDEQVGLRLPTRLVDVEPASVRVGQRVVAEIVDLPGGEFRVPVFHVETPGAG